jgi:hypothetical protein
VKLRHIPLVHLLSAARRGDWETLAQHIEAGGEIPQDMRELQEFLAAVLRGKARPKGRPPSEAVAALNLRLAHSVMFYGGISKSRRAAAEAETAALFNLDIRKVQRASKSYRDQIQRAAPLRLTPLSEDVIRLSDASIERIVREFCDRSRGRPRTA